MADKLEVFEILAEKNDIKSGIEVEEEVKGCDDYQETELTTEDFIDLDTMDYGDQNMMPVLDEY